MKVSTFITLASLCGFGVLGGLGGCAAHLAQKYKALDDQHRACVASLQPSNIIDPGRLCDPAISNDHTAAVAAKFCDQALDAAPENTAALQQLCSAAVKTVVAQRDVARGERDTALADLKTTRAGQSAAIARAEARVQTEAQRKANAVAALARAPRDADGLVVCDADCLRRRVGGS